MFYFGDRSKELVVREKTSGRRFKNAKISKEGVVSYNVAEVKDSVRREDKVASARFFEKSKIKLA